MNIDRPLWCSGALLAPQQFQQQAAWEARTNEQIARLARIHPWGVETVEVDEVALGLGQLKFSRLNVRLPDGSLVQSSDVDRLPPALHLATELKDLTEPTVIVLALALEHGNGGNCLMHGAVAEQPTRYRQLWRQVQDAYDGERCEMAVLQPILELRQEKAVGDYVTCPLVRLVRDGNGAWRIDEPFVPPLLCLSAHPGLLNSLHNLKTQLAAKRCRLMSMRRESNQRMADFAVADVSLFWLLNALNTYQPVLAEFLAHPACHPEAVYLELAKLAGSLMTFSLEHDLSKIPAYQHANLEQVFAPLITLIAELLESSLPSRVITLALTQDSKGRLQVVLHDPRLREPEGVDFYLSVRSTLPALELQAQFPRLCKAGAPDQVDRLVNAALDGIPLVSLPHVPAAIPMRLGNQYFGLDLAHSMGQLMLTAGVCAFYLPASLADAQLELFAVLRS